MRDDSQSLQPPWESSAPPPSASLPPSAARPVDLSTECPHQTTLKPTSPNNLPFALSSQSRVWSARSAPYLRAGEAESPNYCWGVVCSPGHRTLCVRAVRRHRKTCGLEYFTCEVSTVRKVTLWSRRPLGAQLLRLPPCLSQRELMESSQALLLPPRRDARLTGPKGFSR